MYKASEIFRQYNKATAAARRGQLERGRVNRALGIVQTGRGWKYATTAQACNCKDAQMGHICKHRIAVMIMRRIDQERESTAYQAEKYDRVSHGE